MSLETAIQENTKALQYLAEIVKQAMSMKPVQAPAIAVPAPKAEPKAAPINYTELREAMVSKLQKLFEHSPAKGAEILRSFGVRRQSELPDEKLPAFCDALVKALEAEGVL